MTVGMSTALSVLVDFETILKHFQNQTQVASSSVAYPYSTLTPTLIRHKYCWIGRECSD